MKVPETSGSFMEVLGSFHPILTGWKLPSPTSIPLKLAEVSSEVSMVFVKFPRSFLIKFLTPEVSQPYSFPVIYYNRLHGTA